MRLVRKGEKLECVTFSDTIIEVKKKYKYDKKHLLILYFYPKINPKCQQTEELQEWMAADEEE